MPVTIKKKQLPKPEKTSCFLGIAAMLLSMALAATLIVFAQRSGDTEPKALGIAAFAVYVVFTVICVIHFVHGLCVFKRSESYGAVFTAMLTGISLFGMLLNVQFMLAMLFSSAGADSLVNKVIGDSSLSDFMSSQTGAWKFMICGISTAFAVGIIDMLRLAKKR